MKQRMPNKYSFIFTRFLILGLALLIVSLIIRFFL